MLAATRALGRNRYSNLGHVTSFCQLGPRVQTSCGKNDTGPSIPPRAVTANSTERVLSRKDSCP